MDYSPKWIRWGGLAAMLGGVVRNLYAPFHALVPFATEDERSRWRCP